MDLSSVLRIPKRSEGSLSQPPRTFSTMVPLVAHLKFIDLIGIPPLRQAQGRDCRKKLIQSAGGPSNNPPTACADRGTTKCPGDLAILRSRSRMDSYSWWPRHSF